ncbi:MAG: response regulator [Rhizobiaceae bacterium MnEN-MB40S]|nr:MAG: response regulator [Rhizobiaceae bacterium MnEN-MB40S]
MEPNSENPGKSILIVDDDAFDRSLIARNLRTELPNYDLVELSDSSQVISAMAKRRPDLVLLDIWMPSPDGFEVLDAIRSSHDYEGLPVIMLSSSTNPVDKSRARSRGADGYEVKPASLAGYRTLAKAVSARLQER